jgi:muramoyltetrapeptide carboxypeptidase LdcA involved in peptidoglycan recycling
VLANVDYGHATPIITIPLLGSAKINDGKLILQK